MGLSLVELQPIESIRGNHTKPVTLTTNESIVLIIKTNGLWILPGTASGFVRSMGRGEVNRVISELDCQLRGCRLRTRLNYETFLGAKCTPTKLPA